jgi:hypothetical protein
MIAADSEQQPRSAFLSFLWVIHFAVLYVPVVRMVGPVLALAGIWATRLPFGQPMSL